MPSVVVGLRSHGVGIRYSHPYSLKLASVAAKEAIGRGRRSKAGSTAGPSCTECCPFPVVELTGGVYHKEIAGDPHFISKICRAHRGHHLYRTSRPGPSRELVHTHLTGTRVAHCHPCALYRHSCTETIGAFRISCSTCLPLPDT